MAECPICAADVEVAEDTVQGELLTCPDCGSELEVINLDPVTLKEAPEEEEDWGQ